MSTSYRASSDLPEHWQSWRAPSTRPKYPCLVFLAEILSIPCFQKVDRPKLWAKNSSVKSVGKFGSEIIWSLNDECREYWLKLQPQIEGIIKRTPAKSEYESGPIVILYGFFVGELLGQSYPTVIICSSSESYGTLLRKTIKRSGVLNMGNVKFHVKSGKQGVDWHLTADGNPTNSDNTAMASLGSTVSPV